MTLRSASTQKTRSGRKPPYSEEAEKGVLGAALLDGARIIDLCRINKLSEESFFIQAHKVLYRCLLDMQETGRQIDLLTVAEFLKGRGELELVGGADFLDALVDATPVAAYGSHYIEIVRDKFILRELIARANDTIESCYDVEDSAESVLNEAEQRFLSLAEDRDIQMASWQTLVDESLNEINLVIEGKRQGTGLPTGFNNLDEALLGLHGSEMIILAARPSMGKTALAMNIVERMATGKCKDKKDHKVAVFSLEMSAEALTRRMLCSRGRVSSFKLMKGVVSPQEHGDLMQAADILRKAQIFIDDAAGLTPPEIRSRARRMYAKEKIEFVVVDYLQMIHWPEKARNGRQQEVAEISSAMKAMAKELKVPVLILSQLSRAPEQRDKSGKPKLSDLRDSGAIEQDADVVLLLRRPCKYPDDEQSDDERLTIIDIAKNRNGPQGEVRLNFEEDFTRFEDRVDKHHGSPPESDDAF